MTCEMGSGRPASQLKKRKEKLSRGIGAVLVYGTSSVCSPVKAKGCKALEQESFQVGNAVQQDAILPISHFQVLGTDFT